MNDCAFQKYGMQTQAIDVREFELGGNTIRIILTGEREGHKFESENGISMFFTSNREEFRNMIAEVEKAMRVAARREKSRREKEQDERENPDAAVRIVAARQKGQITMLRKEADEKPMCSFKESVAVNATRRPSSEPKRDLKNRAKGNSGGPKKSKKWILWVAAAIAALGIGAHMLHNTSPEIKEPTYSQTREDSVKEVERDFIERYVNAYNKLEGTNYKPEEVIVVANSLSSAYRLNATIVTNGNDPSDVRDTLTRLGEGPIRTEQDVQIVQFIYKDKDGGEHPIGGFDRRGNYVHSGYNVDQLVDPTFVRPTASALDLPQELVVQGAGVVMGKGVEEKTSMNGRIKAYRSAAEAAYTDKDIEEDEPER